VSKTLAYYALRDALSEAGCAVCRLKTRAIERYLDGLLWENVNDPDVRREIRRAQGFCHEHAWGLARHGASLGAAILMRDALQNVLGALRDARCQALPDAPLRRALRSLDHGRQPASAAELLARLTPSAACPACAQGEEMERIYLDTLMEHLLGEDGLLATYEASDGLCLPHFRQVISRAQEETAFSAMVNAQRRIWERLLAQLSEFIRKNDYRFRDEPVGEEGDAWLRAIAALAGAQRESERQ
jgi:hypothetical protein